MYTIVERRTVNLERLQETDQRAQSEFFPKLQQAPGFIGFYLVADETNGINVAVHVWESNSMMFIVDGARRSTSTGISSRATIAVSAVQ